MPAGLFRAGDGRPHNIPGWVMSRSAALRIIDLANDRTNDFVIDFEHQSLDASRNGTPAPAAGWFKRMEWREGDGLYVVDARWTDLAAKMIAAREYRYISPVFSFDKDGNVSSVLNAALTNTPALDGLTDLAAARLTGAPVLPAKHPFGEAGLSALSLSRQALAYQDEQAALGVFVTTVQAVNHVSPVLPVKHPFGEAGLVALSLSRQALAYQDEQAALGVFVTTVQAVNHVSKGA
jgi:phage I-like protein